MYSTESESTETDSVRHFNVEAKPNEDFYIHDVSHNTSLTAFRAH